MSSDPHVVIIGAGISGLALAQGLQRRNINFTVFERDPRLDSRGQGYRLKISGDTVFRVKELVTPEAWAEIEATSAETRMGETTVNASDGGVLACRRLPAKGPTPATWDRGMLRKALMTGIEGRVRFGETFESYALGDNGAVKVTFESGAVEHGTLLVGADGSRSRIRRQLAPELKWLDTGTCCVYGKTPLTDELRLRYPERYRRWITVVRDRTPVLSEIKAGESPITLVSEPVCFSGRHARDDLPCDYIHWGLMFPKESLGLDESEISQACRHNPVDIGRRVTEFWDPSVKALLDLQDMTQTSAMPIVSAKSLMPPWTTVPQVTLVGDAVHVMSPAGGQGAATALWDVWKLALTIGHRGITADVIREYEAFMRGNASAGLMMTREASVVLCNQRPESECGEVD